MIFTHLSSAEPLLVSQHLAHNKLLIIKEAFLFGSQNLNLEHPIILWLARGRQL